MGEPIYISDHRLAAFYLGLDLFADFFELWDVVYVSALNRLQNILLQAGQLVDYVENIRYFMTLSSNDFTEEGQAFVSYLPGYRLTHCGLYASLFSAALRMISTSCSMSTGFCR